MQMSAAFRRRGRSHSPIFPPTSYRAQSGWATEPFLVKDRRRQNIRGSFSLIPELVLGNKTRISIIFIVCVVGRSEPHLRSFPFPFSELRRWNWASRSEALEFTSSLYSMVPLTTSPTWIFTVRTSCWEERGGGSRRGFPSTGAAAAAGPAHPHLRAVLVGLFPAVRVDLPQQVLDAAVVELVTPAAVLVQLAYLAHEEVGNLWGGRGGGATFDPAERTDGSPSTSTSPTVHSRSW